jgi:hypothetical protein
VRLWRLHTQDKMTVRQLAEMDGKSEHPVSAMLKVGERFSS